MALKNKISQVLTPIARYQCPFVSLGCQYCDSKCWGICTKLLLPEPTTQTFVDRVFSKISHTCFLSQCLSGLGLSAGLFPCHRRREAAVFQVTWVVRTRTQPWCSDRSHCSPLVNLHVRYTQGPLHSLPQIPSTARHACCSARVLSGSLADTVKGTDTLSMSVAVPLLPAQLRSSPPTPSTGSYLSLVTPSLEHMSSLCACY